MERHSKYLEKAVFWLKLHGLLPISFCKGVAIVERKWLIYCLFITIISLSITLIYSIEMMLRDVENEAVLLVALMISLNVMEMTQLYRCFIVIFFRNNFCEVFNNIKCLNILLNKKEIRNQEDMILLVSLWVIIYSCNILYFFCVDKLLLIELITLNWTEYLPFLFIFVFGHFIKTIRQMFEKISQLLYSVTYSPAFLKYLHVLDILIKDELEELNSLFTGPIYGTICVCFLGIIFLTFNLFTNDSHVNKASVLYSIMFFFCLVVLVAICNNCSHQVSSLFLLHWLYIIKPFINHPFFK